MRTILLSSIILLTSTAHAIDSEISLRHRESKGVGYNKGYSTLDYLLTLQRTNVELLFNLRGHVFNNGRTAGNAGLGLRYSLNDDSSRIGMNAFYDFRDDHRFFAQQSAVGFEWISRRVDIRLNGYLPVGKQKSFQKYAFQNFSGNRVFTKQKFSASLPCVEGEIGTSLFQPFYLAAGSYYLFRESSHSARLGKSLGWKMRFDIDMGRHVTLGAITTHDSIFKTRVQGYLSLHVPIGGSWKSTESGGTRDLRHVPIVRNELIPFQTRKDSKMPLVSKSNETPLSVLFVNNQATAQGDGTFEYPFASLKEAEKNSKTGDIIYIYPGDGTPHGMDEGIVLKENQILASSGSPLLIEPLIIPPQTPGVNPIITNIHPNRPIITNPGHSDLNSFYFMDPWEYLRKYDSYSYSIDTPSSSGAPTLTPRPSSEWDDTRLKAWVDLGQGN